MKTNRLIKIAKYRRWVQTIEVKISQIFGKRYFPNSNEELPFACFVFIHLN